MIFAEDMPNGTVAFVGEYPDCDFCGIQAKQAKLLGRSELRITKARYDFRTRDGRWANGCFTHWVINRMHRELGVGKGQLMKLAETAPATSGESDPGGQS